MLKVAGGVTTGNLSYQGTWDANTNTPTLTSSVGTQNYYYVVSTAGSTDLNGITDWQIGDWAIFNGTVWQKIDQSPAVQSVNGQTGAVVLTAANVGAVANTVHVIAGTGLTGGGQLTGNVTISLASNVNVGNLTVDFIDFNTAANITVTESVLTWNADAGTLAVGVEGGLPLNIGTENLVKVYNNTGSPLAKGDVVSVTGAQGQVPTVALSSASSEPLSRDTLGIVQEAIPNADTGFVCTFGVVNNINTYGTTAGDPIYLSTSAGDFTSTEPQAPNHIVMLGWVVRVANTPSSNDGQIFVTINNGWELNELHNVQINSPLNNQLLAYSTGSNVWINTSNISVNNVTAANVTVTANLFANLSTSNTAAMPDPSLPLAPEGYVTIYVNGTAKKIPYYGV